ALIICGEEEWPDLNLRVDDHADPLAELERLESVSRERFVHFMRMLPSRSDRGGVTDRGIIESRIAQAHEATSLPPPIRLWKSKISKSFSVTSVAALVTRSMASI